ncbi:DUF1266 domain-containing protein [Streptomyces hoynatensis]|uniref:DUF1266 domain-containing protein n=1 Tax=Streptomyces hoynatensis TaxID=1141874 RepID=A0A3A9Z273_9ACTN|nr:DUF1266 domain-containing protein [Streptomyces hoynatensis]RKN42348.1 DUF1266 domain-containing protein [Streptomyces hoynatensis]
MGSEGATEGIAEGVAWQPPTAVEQGLYEAGLRGDWQAFFSVLAATDLFFPMSRELADAVPHSLRFSPFRDPHVEGLCLPVFTRGMLPPPSGAQVFERGDLGGLAKAWPRPVRWLAINPGTPLETFLPAEPKRWRRHARNAPAESPLKTLWTGDRHGPLAHGMACGALLLVNNGSIWNHLGWQNGGYTEEKELLASWWGVSGRDDWLAIQERLLNGDVISPAWEFVLRVRQAMIKEYGAVPGAVQWRETAERVLLSRTAELVDQTGRPPDFDLDADIALVQDLIGRILRYEARFRADGLLDADAGVRSVLAWDFGRASCMARWGLGARYCDLAETERAVLRAGAGARRVYRSWPDFATGYILGRCLHFDGEEFGEWYAEMVAAFRILATDPESPWLSVPWEQPAADRTEL